MRSPDDNSVTAITEHLIRRRVLTKAEQGWLDLDGDGVVTARDLVLAKAGARSSPMPAVAPAAHLARGGEWLYCRMRGAFPKKMAVVVMVAGARRTVEHRLAAQGGEVAVRLPVAGEHKDPVEATLWFTAPGRTPVSFSILLCSGPVIEGARWTGAETVAVTGRGWSGEGEDLEALAGERCRVRVVSATEVEVSGPFAAGAALVLRQGGRSSNRFALGVAEGLSGSEGIESAR